MRSHLWRAIRTYIVVPAALSFPAMPVTAAVLLVPESYGTIQAAVDAAASTDTISVAAGTYRGPGNRAIQILAKSVLLRSREGPERTVLDCEQAGQAFYLDGPHHTPTIEGFTMVNGVAVSRGGAVECALVDPTFRRCVFASNRSAHGGAVKLGVGTSTFEDCRFLGNDATYMGGGIAALGGSVHCIGCVFTGNSSYGPGGAVQSDAATLNFTGCTVASNQMRSAHDGGGGIFSFDAAIALDQTICRDNCGNGNGDEIYCVVRLLTLRCSNVNMAGVHTQQLVEENNIDAAALFCDPRSCYSPGPEGDYRLRSDSPCLPEGNPCGLLIGALEVGCPGPGTGGCCLGDGSCILARPEDCSFMQGHYLGDGTVCEPNPCGPTPVETVRWGRIKATFR